MNELILQYYTKGFPRICAGLLLIILFFLSSCNQSGEIMLDEKDNGSKIQLSQGEDLTITLDSNPSTGYGWQVAESDEAILQQVGKAEYITSDPAGQPLPGQGGKEILRFVSVSPGKTTLSLFYIRPWEDDVEAEQTFSIEVSVR
jgi:inhibitor of cysteine peptidase